MAGEQPTSESYVEALVSFKEWKRPVRLLGSPPNREADICSIKSVFPEIDGQEFNLQITGKEST